MSDLTGASPLAARRADLEAKHGGWRIWSSDAGVWYATRTSTLSRGALYRGCAQTVHGDALEDLAGALADQDAKDQAVRAELGTVT